VPYKSPFLPALEQRGAVVGPAAGVETALHYGDPEAEARLQTAVVDLAWRAAVDMTGRDRVRFLHGMCTNDIKKLQTGESCVAAIVNRQGKMVAEVIVWATADALRLVVDRANAQPMIDHLQRFIIADDVTLRLSETGVLGVYGGDLPDGPIEPSLPLPGRMVFGALDGRPPMGFEAWERLRINHGYPRWGVDMGPDLLPMEAGLEPIAIRYDKGCYIGQEVIQRVKTYSEPPRMLVQLQLDGPASPGTPVLADGQEVGHVTSAAGTAALALVRKEHKAPGTRLAAGGATAVVRPLPWSTP